MSHVRTSHRIGIVVLLVALLTGLLPARPSLARSAQPAPNLSANTPVDVSPEGVRAEFWVANAMNRVDGPQRAEMVAFELVLMHLYKQNPDLPPATAVQNVRDLQTAYRNVVQSDPARYPKSANEGVLSVMAILSSPPLSSSPSFGAVVAAAHEAYEVTLRESINGNLVGAERILGASESYLAPQTHESAQQTLLHKALEFARQNPRFGQAFDTLWSADLHVSAYASTAAIIQSSSSLQSLTGTIGLIDSAGAIHTTVGSVKSLVDTEFFRINTVLTDSLTLLKDISDHQKTELVDAAKDEGRKAQDKDKADKADEKASKELKEAKENIELLAKFAKYVDSDWGEQIETVGKAGIEIADALSKFAKQVAEVGALQAITSISTLALTGNVIGAVSSVISLFSDSSKPKPEQKILDQIAALRNQVKALSSNMNDRFDRVDKALNRIYGTMIDRFNRINIQLGVLQGDVQEIQTTLADMQRQLDRMEQHIFVLLTDGFQHPLLQQMNGSIGYYERTGDVMDYSEYKATPDGPENTFHSWATLFSRDALAIGTPPSSYDDADVYNQLTLPIPGSSQLVRPLDTNINFFSQFINVRWGFPALSGATIVNPRIWSLSARAYTELELDWPDNARRIDANRALQIIQKGQELQTALRKISTIDTSNGPAANYPLFDKLITNYKEKIASFDQAVQQVENDYLIDKRTRTEPDRIGLIDPWGGVNQPLDPANLNSLTIPQAPLCGETNNAKPLPNNFAKTMLAAPFQLAHYLDPDPNMHAITAALSSCYDAHWVELRHGAIGWPEPHDVTYAKLQVDLIANYTAGGTTQAIRTRSIKLPEQLIDDDGEWGHRPPLDPRATATANWESGRNIKLRFETDSQVTTDGPVPADVITRVGDALKAHQQGIYQAVVDALAGVGPVAQAARRLTGAKALLSAGIGLGLPRALEADEYLRSFLYGDQALPDEAADKRLTLLWAKAKAELPAQNARGDYKALMDRRADALKEATWRYLGQIDQHTYGESHRLIDTTLDRLKIANAMIRTPILSLSAGAISFGNQLIGAPSATRTITLTNSGLAAPISISGISPVGANVGDFTGGTTCGASLAAGASCTVALTFTPAAYGNRTAELRITSNAPGAPHSIPLSGAGWLDATFNAPSPVAEGSPINLSLRNQSDLSDTTPWGPDFTYAFDCGTGYGSFGALADAACPTSDNGARTVKAKVKYKSNDLVEFTAPLTVTNIAPTASFAAPAAIAEGGAITVALQSVVDPSSADTVAGFSYAFDCGAGYGAFGLSASVTCPTNDSGERVVKGKVQDKDNGVTEYSATVSIGNVAPTASFSAPSTINEGSPISVVFQNVADPSSADTAAGFGYAFDCGAGYGAFGASSTTACPTSDSGTRTVKGKVKDKDSGVTEYSTTVTVANVAPTASFAVPASVSEGSPISLAFQNVVDVAGDLPTLQYAFDCGAGYGAFGSSKTASCPTTDNGTRVVKGKVKDKDGGVREYAANVTIVNVAPAASFNAPQHVVTGQKFDLSLNNVVDAPGDLPTLQYAFDCGDGAGYGAFRTDTGASCETYAAGVRTVRGKVKDKDGAVREYSASVTIADALSLSIMSPFENQEFMVDETVNLWVAFTDENKSPEHTCTVSWGDDSQLEEGLVKEGFESGTCEAKHSYTAPGKYTIKVSMTNTFGDTSTAAVTIVVLTIGK